MRDILYTKRFLAAVSAGLATMAILLVAATASSVPTNLQKHLQMLADEAASAASASLGASAGQSKADRHWAALMAAQDAIAGQGVQSQIAISVETDKVETDKVAVSLTANRSALFGGYLGGTQKIVKVQSRAEYVFPDLPSNWSWAPRHYFAGKRQGIALQSTCPAIVCGTKSTQ